ncbi:MAG: hypothetical protein ACI8Z1_001981 [Candidatus Azotimanducaceae bacterium]|jgi:hypothetical protein
MLVDNCKINQRHHKNLDWTVMILTMLAALQSMVIEGQNGSRAT